jgi:hypothetical protein
MEKLKLVWFFLIGIYSYIHRAFVIYFGSVEVIANFLTVLLFRHEDVTIHVAGKWDINTIKAITYIIHLLIVLFLYFLIF